MAKPILYNGMGSPQSIYDSSATAYHNVGTRGFLPNDGRVFYYTRNGATALDPGKLAMSPVIAATEANLAVAAANAGQNKVTVTPGAITFTANQLAEGYLCVNDVDSEGYTYKIKSHPAVASATAFEMTLYDDLKVAFTANTEVTMLRNPWADVVIAAAAAAHMPVGVPTATIAANEYGWLQTWGVCAGWDDASTAIGAPLASGATAGQMDIAAEGASTLTLTIGVQLYTGVATEYYPKFLMIAP